jgi:hypothetical protein
MGVARMKKGLIGALLAVFVGCPILWATKAEKEAKKLDQELKKISLTAAVMDGRRVVNRVVAHELGVSRKQLVEERRHTGFVYGQLYGAHEVGRLAGLSFNQVAGEMKQGHSLYEISEQHQVELKQVLTDTKRLNKGVQQELDRVANGEENEKAEDEADSYDPSDDTLSSDAADFSPAEIAQASQQVHDRGMHLGQGGFGSSGQGRPGAFGGGIGGGHGHH